VVLLRGTGAHVNCIPMNPVAHTPWRASAPERVAAFAARLSAGGIGVTVRRNRGQEVGAACGQLAAEMGGEAPPPEVARRRDRLVLESATALRGERSAEPPPVPADDAAPARQAPTTPGRGATPGRPPFRPAHPGRGPRPRPRRPDRRST
jgi:hypothetical protein